MEGNAHVDNAASAETTQRSELMNKEMVWFNILCTFLAAKRRQEKVNTVEMDEKWMMRIWSGWSDGCELQLPPVHELIATRKLKMLRGTYCKMQSKVWSLRAQFGLPTCFALYMPFLKWVYSFYIILIGVECFC